MFRIELGALNCDLAVFFNVSFWSVIEAFVFSAGQLTPPILVVTNVTATMATITHTHTLPHSYLIITFSPYPWEWWVVVTMATQTILPSFWILMKHRSPSVI